VTLDRGSVALYGVEAKVLNQAEKRHAKPFPEDFMFQLTAREVADLKSQSVTTSSGCGGRCTRPYALTEQGVAMLSGVLLRSAAHSVSFTHWLASAIDLPVPSQELRIARPCDAS
jgi:hypothetical protein